MYIQQAEIFLKVLFVLDQILTVNFINLGPDLEGITMVFVIRGKNYTHLICFIYTGSIYFYCFLWLIFCLKSGKTRYRNAGFSTSLQERKRSSARNYTQCPLCLSVI